MSPGLFRVLFAVCWATAIATPNSDAVREITELIKAQRGYELNAKVITAADQMLGATTQLR